MKIKFEGENGRRLLINSLMRQQIIEGSAELAEQLVSVAQLRDFKVGESLIHEGDHNNEIFFLLTGSVSVRVFGTEIAQRNHRQHVGEMALIDPMQPRCASIVATNPVTAAIVSEPDFSRLSQNFPRLWRMLALELADRLRQRNQAVQPSNVRPVLFIGSSAESIPIVNEIEHQLQHANILIKKWNTNVFRPSHYPIDDLKATISTSDFGLLVLSGEDLTASRNELRSTPRDNVIYEAGMSTGELGRERTLLLQPRGVDLKIPSDLFGLNPISFAIGPEGDTVSALGPAVTEIEKVIARIGCRYT